MTQTQAFDPTIVEVLEEFFASYKPSAGPAVRERVDLVRTDLDRQLETYGPHELTTAQLAIVATERQFTPHGAVARTMRAPELYYVLVTYLRPEFAMEGNLQRETQLDVIAAIEAWLWQRRLIDADHLDECAVIDSDVWMRRARDVLRAAKRNSSDAKF